MLLFLSGSGFTVNVVTSDKYVKRDSGLILWDIAAGTGDCPKDGQQVFLCFYLFLEMFVTCFPQSLSLIMKLET